ncbi:coiled-coil domain-containing protein mad1 [Elasticomyces elasticus]|nr:coiled-coil domain-containing protein mad1 [Elasticomyces elasticus]KAK3654993.1 coiled-coil domain-containing protein mad1 [Elasticomyces elasticus]KAK4914038.1 coiled-coil domain-containing protein mad1 [Elasticomyces elasticus]KAK5757480.1 coiled-coil domain-containing protein mad1 [Elasticomyces elasticus]
MTARNQPTYDFLSGSPAQQPAQQPLRETLKQAVVSRGDINNENLRAQVNTLQYELDSLRHEKEVTALSHQTALRDTHSRSETLTSRLQTAESLAKTSTQKSEALSRELQEERDRSTNERILLEKKIRSLQEDSRQLREDLEESHAELASRERESRYAGEEQERKYETLRASVEGVQQDLEQKVGVLQGTQQRLAAKETEVGELENEVLRLRATAGDSETLAVVKKELSEQMAYIKKLELSTREQNAELRNYRKTQKSIEIVEEEKRALEARVRMMEDLRRELAEQSLQRRILEDERRGWTSYLEGQDGEGMRFGSPEEMAKAFLQERVERLGLVDRLGKIGPELGVREENIRSLEDDKARLSAELNQLRASRAADTATTQAPMPESRARLRLERQLNLAKKEVEYLRAQAKAAEAEETEFGLNTSIDVENQRRIHSLEAMVEQFRTECQTLHAELSNIATLEVQTPATAAISPQKRPREDNDNDERLGELRRKTRSLQDELDVLRSSNAGLRAELEVCGKQLTALRSASRTRTLELRNNPTAEVEKVKMVTLTTLREENKGLLAQLEGKPHSAKVVPISTLESVRLEVKEREETIKGLEKKMLRLKQIWSSKALEFREAVASILGWKIDFMPNGRVSVSSLLYPDTVVVDEETGEEVVEVNAIVFDGEQGTMKVSGGPRSAFAGVLAGGIEFWVEGRKSVPGFLAASTLEFYERGVAMGEGGGGEG